MRVTEPRGNIATGNPGGGKRARVWHLASCLLLLAVVALAGCGGSSASSTTTISAAQLRAAKKTGEEKARERDRVNNLQRQLHNLKRQVKHRSAVQTGNSAPAPPSTSSPAPESNAPVRSFHAPSGNVSCEILTDGASCTVESVGETFAFEAGEPARIEPTATLPSALGELIDYGNTVSVGSISCEVPPSDVARGITCSDATSGHGFEASRVPARQSAY